MLCTFVKNSKIVIEVRMFTSDSLPRLLMSSILMVKLPCEISSLTELSGSVESIHLHRGCPDRTMRSGCGETVSAGRSC